MRSLLAPTVLLAIAATASAAAQNASSVTVNPMGAQVLYDPGTGQERVVPPLLMPGDDEPIRLRPPKKHVHQARPAVQAEAAAPETAPRTVRKPRHRMAAAPPPAAAPQPVQQGTPASGLSDLAELVSQPPVQAAPPPRRRAETPKPEAPRAEAPRPEAVPRAEKPAPRSPAEETRPAKPRLAAGLKRDSIVFTAGATDPSTSAVSSLRALAGSLISALSDGSARVQLMAYAGMKGEKTSDTRRLSLKRALIVRQLLIDDGVPAERIDVLALGGAEDDGPLDRVDVIVKN